jgi:Transcriptional regulator
MPSKGSDLARAMTRILTALYMHEEDVAIRDIAEECGIPKSTLHRTLQTLKEEGWVHQGADGSYRIGLRLLVLASQARLRMELVKQLDPIMRRIAAATQQTVVLSVLDGRQSVCLHTIESNKRIRIDSQVGSRGDLHAGASGKALLAFGPAELLDELLTEPLTKYTPFTLTEPNELRREVEAILENGYAVSIEELDPGAAAIAVPILDTHGELIAGISIAGPRFDFEGNIAAWSQELRRLTEPVLDYDADREGVCLAR